MFKKTVITGKCLNEKIVYQIVFTVLLQVIYSSSAKKKALRLDKLEWIMLQT